MKYQRITLGVTLGIAIAAGGSLVPQPGQTQEFLDTLRGGMNVVATAGMGSNNVTVITLTDVEVTSFELCRQSPPERLESCRQEVEAEGKLRTEWSVNCRNLSITASNRYVRDLTHEIDPQSSPARYNDDSYAVYDYACGTRYSEQ